MVSFSMFKVPRPTMITIPATNSDVKNIEQEEKGTIKKGWIIKSNP